MNGSRKANLSGALSRGSGTTHMISLGNNGGAGLQPHHGHFGKIGAWRSSRLRLAQAHHFSGRERTLNEESRLGNLDQFVKEDRRWFAGANRPDGRFELLAVALVLHATELLDPAVARELEGAEIIEARDRALAEHFEEFLGYAAVAIGQVKQICNRSIREVQHHCNVIQPILSAVRQAGSSHAQDRGTGHRARPIHEVAKFAHNTAARAVDPMVRRNVAGIDARVNEHGLMTRGKELADFFGKRRESAVEACHHERSGASEYLCAILLL